MTVSAQTFEQEYEQALLDSAYRYELLKPTYYKLIDAHQNLKVAYEYKGKENEGLQMSIVQIELQRKREKRRAFWRGFKTGGGVAVITAAILIIL